jgi:multiple sugar transport system substrate-binding protein
MRRATTTSSAPHIARRAALAGVGAVGLGALLWPRRPRSRAGIPSGRVVLDYWEKWTGSEGLALQKVVDRYNQSQGKVWVRRIPVADIVPKTMVAIAGRDPPDLAGLYSFNIPQLAESRAAMSFDEFSSSAAPMVTPDIYAPAVSRLLTYQGRQWAAVTSCYALGLYCNLTHMKELGIAPGSLPRTISQLDALAERLTRRASDGALTRTGFQQNLPQWWPYTWPALFGNQLFDPVAGKATIAEATGIAAYQWIQETAARLGIAPARALARTFDRSYHTPGDPFFSGRASMVLQGPWLASFARTNAPTLEFMCVPPPVHDPLFDPDSPLGIVEADILIIPRGCRHPREAYDFARFMQRRDVQEEICRAHGKSSPLRDVSPEFSVDHPNPHVQAFDSIIKSPRASILPQTRTWQQYADMTGGLFDRAWNGEPVAPAVQQVQNRAQELINLAAERQARRSRGAPA